MHAFKKASFGVSAALCAAMLVAGCSSSGGGSNAPSGGGTSGGGGTASSPAGAGSSTDGGTASTSGSTGDASGLAAAKAVVAQISVPSNKIAPAEPLKTKAPTGKKIIFIQPKTLGDDAIKSGDELTNAAKLLGWSVQRLPVAGDVPSVQQGIEQALQLKPDGIMLWTGASTDELKAQIDEARTKNVPIWLGATDLPDTLPFPIIGGQGGTQTRGRQSAGIAAYIATNSQCKNVSVGYINLRENAAVVKFGQNVEQAMKKFCPDAKYTSIDNGLADIGQRLPNNVVSAIQADSSINYIVTSAGAFMAGVPAALRAAGLQDKVIITGTNPADSDIAAVKDGTGAPWATIESSWFGWYAIDSFARYFTKTPLVNEGQAPDPLLLLTKENFKDSDGGQYYTKNGESKADLVAQFKKDWLLS